MKPHRVCCQHPADLTCSVLGYGLELENGDRALKDAGIIQLVYDSVQDFQHALNPWLLFETCTKQAAGRPALLRS